MNDEYNALVRNETWEQDNGLSIPYCTSKLEK